MPFPLTDRPSPPVSHAPARSGRPAAAPSGPRPPAPTLAGGVLGFVGFRVGLVLYAVFVPVFWIWYRPDLTGDVDPLGLRLGLSACATAVLAATFVSRWARRRIVELFVGLLYLLTAWFFPLVFINRLDPNYVIGILLITVSSAFGIAVMGGYEGRVQRLRWYLGFVITATLAVSLFAPAPEIGPVQFVATIIVIVAMAYLCALVSASAERRLVRSEAAARASDERFRRVFENVHDVLFEVDADGRWTLLSPAWARISGFSIEESLGRSCYEFVYGEDAAETYRRAQTLFERGEEVLDEVVRIRTAEGRVRWVEVRSRLTYDEAGGMTGAAGTLADVTDSFRVQAEQEARQRAEDLLRLKSSFLNNMSHELRTPLTGIIGFAEVLAEEVEGEQAEFAHVIESSARRLLGTVNSVLDLAQLEGRGFEFHPEPINVAAEVAEGVRLLQPLAERKGIALAVDGSGEVDAEMDPHALHRVVTNLVGNAIKFTDRGGVVVRVRGDRSRVRLWVEDTGIGIPPDVLPRMFEPFRQASEGLARGHEGNGLGLSITRQIVELAGGTIEVESEVGVGTCFHVALPRWPASRERTDSSAAPSLSEAADLQGAPVA